jgi:hypothetical protein
MKYNMNIKGVLAGEGNHWKWGGQNERVLGGEYDQSSSHECMKKE